MTLHRNPIATTGLVVILTALAVAIWTIGSWLFANGVEFVRQAGWNLLLWLGWVS